MTKTIKEHLYEFLDNSFSPREISGWELQSEVFQLTGRQTYPSTLLAYARDYADITGSEFKCLSSKTSKYFFERERKIGDAIFITI